VQPRGGVGEVDLPRELAGTRLDGGGHGGRRRSKERRGERHTPPEKVRGSVFKVGSRCYATLLRAQRLTGAAAAYGGTASRAARAVQPERASGGDTRRARTSMAPRSAALLGKVLLRPWEGALGRASRGTAVRRSRDDARDARRRGATRRQHRPASTVIPGPVSDVKNSKKLNRSAPSDE
jgi:hypothetical protein